MPSAEGSLSERLAQLTREGELYERLPGDRVRCFACGHRCLIKPGRDGVCRVRFNEDGVLLVPHGYVGRCACDPIEKKPFFHVLPGSDALTFGMLGCDFHCGYCQNWVTTPDAARPERRRPAGRDDAGATRRARAEHGARVVTSTYNEPLITSEWAVDVFKEAQGRRASSARTSPTATARRRCSTSSGRSSTRTRSTSRPSATAHYRELGGVLENVLGTIRALHEQGFWVEIVTLVVPGFNDSAEELREIAEFLASVVARHAVARDRVPPGLQDDRATADTSVAALLRACGDRRPRGRLHFVYAGNLPGAVGELGEHATAPAAGRC